MVIDRIGAQYEYEGVTYTIGGKIYANCESDFEGLFGIITEIRDGDDRETENDTPDIYCEFMPPVLPDEIKTIEERFSRLYQTEKHLDDIGIDMVIMAPEMLRVLDFPSNAQKLEIFLIREDWAYDGDFGVSSQMVTSYDLARFIFNHLIYDEQLDGYIARWSHRQDLDTEAKKDFYECWLHDEYCENHYKVTIERVELTMDDDIFAFIGKAFVDSVLRKQFAQQIEDWEEIEGFTPVQLAELIASPDVPVRIRKQLSQNGILEETYWKSVSEASFALVKKFLEKLH